MNLKRILPVALSVSLLCSVTACKNSGKTNEIKNPDAVVATVGDEKITAREFQFYVNMEKSQIETQQGIAEKSDKERKNFWDAEENAETKQSIIDNALNSLEELKLLLMSAKKDNFQLKQEHIDNVNSGIEEFIKTEGEGDRKKAEKKMKDLYGVTLDEYKQMYQDYMHAYINYATDYPNTIEVSDEELKAEFEKHKDDYKKVTVKHILLATTDEETMEALPPDKVEEKKRLAEEILNKAKAGEDFEAMVKQYSEDPGSVDQGGEYTFGRGEMVSEFEDWSFKAKEGDMGIVQSTYGFHIMKFIKNIDPTFEDEKENVKSTAQQEIFTKKMDELKEKNPLVKNQEVIDELNLF